MAIKHKYQSALPDDPGAEISTTVWNDDHDITSLELGALTADPATLSDGMIWWRSDLAELRARSGGRTVIIDQPPMTDGQNLYPWRSELAALKAGALITPKIMLFGDSWFWRRIIPQTIADALYAHGQGADGWIPVTTGVGFTFNDITMANSGWTLHDASEGGVVPLGIDGHRIDATGTAATLTLTGVRAATLNLYYRNTTGTFRYRVDGGTWVVVTGTGTNAIAKVSITGLSQSVTHGLDIDLTGNTGTVTLYGLYATGMVGIEVNKVGNGGSTAPHNAAHITSPEAAFILADMQPRVTMIVLGNNDAGTSVPLTTYKAGLDTIMTAIQTAVPLSSFILAATPRNGRTGQPVEGYAAQMSAFLAEGRAVDLLDYTRLFGPFAEMSALGLWADNAHLNDLGAQAYSDLAMPLLDPAPKAAATGGGGGTSVAWADITGKPITVAASGILDAVDLTSTQLVTGEKTFTDNKLIIADDFSPTKRAVFQCSGITAGATRFISLPNANGTLALTTLFTDAASGLVPASGGGTVNFLRADGVFAAPPGGAGGVSDGDKGDVIVSSGGAVWGLDYTAVNAVVAPTWGNITGKPTTVAASGLTDAATTSALALKANITDVLDGLAARAPLVHDHAFADLTAKPTTLAGFGITDGITASAVAAGYQAKDAGLTALAGLSTSGLYYLSAADVWSPVTIGANLTFTGGTLAASGGGGGSTPGSVAVLIPDSGEVIGTTLTGAATSTQAVAADRMELFQYTAPRDISIQALYCRISTANAGALGKIIMYAADANGRPDALIHESADLDFSTTGNKSTPLTMTLLKGVTYFFGLRTAGATAVYVTWANTSVPYLAGGTPNASARASLRRTLAYTTAAPTNWGWSTADLATNNPVAIWLQVA